MRISVVGAQNTGKTTFIEDFIANWPMYRKPEVTYRDIIAKKSVQLNQSGNRESQFAILDALCDQAKDNADMEFCIHDRCVIDNLAYTMWLAAKDKGDVKPTDVTASIIQAQQVLKYYDIIFFLPISAMSNIPLEERANRDIDENYRSEIDMILKAFNADYTQQKGNVFPKEDCPAVIEIFGDRAQRVSLASMYIKPNGKAYGEEDGSLISLDSDPDELSLFEKDRILQQLSV